MKLVEIIKTKYPSLTDINPGRFFVYVCLNDDWLLAVGQTTKNRPDALEGSVTSKKHTKAGICMMASAIRGTPNKLFYIPSDEENNLDSIEKDVKALVREHYNLRDKKQGGTYVDGISSNVEVSMHLKKLLLAKHAGRGDNSFDDKIFSFNDILEIVNIDGDAWSNLVTSQLTSDVVRKFLLAEKN